MKKIKIAIDGPAGSGKSVVGKKIADKLGYQFIDTGLIYRAFTYFCLTLKINFKNLNEIKNALENFHCQFKNTNVIVNNIDVTSFLTLSDVVNNIQKISSFAIVRDKLNAILQVQVTNKGVVMIGRDITTVVLPNAELKIYLTASLSVRAHRRWEQEKTKKTLQQVQEEIKIRDISDTHRKIAPLVIANDAIVLDNSKLTIEQTVSEISMLVKETIGVH